MPNTCRAFRGVTVATTILCISLMSTLGCKETPDKAEHTAVPESGLPGSAAVSAAPAPVQPPESEAPVASASGSAAAEPGGELSAVPAIPTERSSPPTVAEWSTAREVNTQGAATRAVDCTMKVHREWLRVHCTGEVVRLENELDLGKEGADYFEEIRYGSLASVVFRLVKGKTQGVRICRRKDRATLFANWPASQERPKIIALGKGPACD